MFKELLKSISDDDLLRRLSGLVQQSRRVESELVAHIAEVDERRLYAREACSSMFAYCTEVLHLSEWEAYLRIAGSSLNFPVKSPYGSPRSVKLLIPPTCLAGEARCEAPRLS